MGEVKPNEVSTTGKSCCWSITINNPTEDDFVKWNMLKGYPWVKEVLGQVEKGENGTPHIQGMVKTLSVRFSQVKRALPRAHIEVARNAAALAKYVVKEETRQGSIPQYKVATQADCQKRILDLTYEAYMKEDREDTLGAFYSWMETEEITNPKFGECMIDAAVKTLIKEGYYGIEFVMCNPQVRAGFKKYFKEIVIREYYAASQKQPQDQAPSQDDNTPPDAPPPRSIQ